MSDDETTGLVFHLFGPPPAVEGAPSVEYGGRMCSPHSPVVRQLQRTVTCKRCKETLKPDPKSARG